MKVIQTHLAPVRHVRRTAESHVRTAAFKVPSEATQGVMDLDLGIVI